MLCQQVLITLLYISALRSWQERDFCRSIRLALWRSCSRMRSRPWCARGTRPDRKRLALLVRLSRRPPPGDPSVQPGPKLWPRAALTAVSRSSLVPWSSETDSSRYTQSNIKALEWASRKEHKKRNINLYSFIKLYMICNKSWGVQYYHQCSQLCGQSCGSSKIQIKIKSFSSFRIKKSDQWKSIQ